MKTHELKLLQQFSKAVWLGEKTFEIRKNDRDFQVGDYIRFQVVDENGAAVESRVNHKLYRITYVLEGWGLEPGYAALAIQEVGGLIK